MPNKGDGRYAPRMTWHTFVVILGDSTELEFLSRM